MSKKRTKEAMIIPPGVRSKILKAAMNPVYWRVIVAVAHNEGGPVKALKTDLDRAMLTTVLRVLHNLGVIERRREGRTILQWLTPAARDVLKPHLKKGEAPKSE